MADRLSEAPFAYRLHRDGRANLFCDGGLVRTLRGDKAARFAADLADAGDTEAQLMMARLTGNFKRGDERRSVRRSGR